MEDLTKQQLILLALLISFVTSLATGIFTVSLMSQAPQGVVQSIGQVVEKTIERAVSQSANTSSAQDNNVNNASHALSTIMNSIVRLHAIGDESYSLGIVVGQNGVILTDRSALKDNVATYEAVSSNGNMTSISIVQSQLNGDVVFLAPTVTMKSSRSVGLPAIIATTTILGQDVFSLSLVGTSTPVLSQGIVTTIGGITNADYLVSTNIPLSSVISGSPLFNNKGEIIAIRMHSLGAEGSSQFYLVDKLRSVIPAL
jgi:hypothetical protein